MRLVYIVQYFQLPSESGSSRAYEQARRFVQAGHEVHVVSSVREESSLTGWQYSKIKGVHVHRFPVPYNNRMSVAMRIRAFLKFAYVAALKVRGLKGDVVLASSTPLTTAIPGLLASKFPAKPFIFEVRDMWPDLPIEFGALRSPFARAAARLLERAAYTRAEHIVALSPDMKRRVLELAPAGTAVSVIPNAADVELFTVSEDQIERWLSENSWLPRGRPLAVYVGTLGLANRVGFLVEVAKHLRDLESEVVILIVGDGMEKEEVMAAAEKHGCINNNVYFMDRVPKRDVPLIYGASNVVLSCLAPMKSLEASSPNKVFDAFAAGRPVAVNYKGWVSELLVESGAGIAPGHDAEVFAKELHAFMVDSQELSSASSASARLGRDEFDRNKLVTHFTSVLEESVSEPNLTAIATAN